MLEIVCNSSLLTSSECFLEVRVEPREEVLLFVGNESTNSVAFISALWNVSDLVSRRTDYLSSCCTELVCACLTRDLLSASCRNGSFRAVSTAMPCLLLSATPSLYHCEILISAVPTYLDEETRHVLRRVGCGFPCHRPSAQLFTDFILSRLEKAGMRRA